MPGNIHARLAHDLHRARIQPRGVRTGGIRLDAISVQMTRPGFSHLAATVIAGTQEQDPAATHGVAACPESSGAPRQSNARHVARGRAANCAASMVHTTRSSTSPSLFSP